MQYLNKVQAELLKFWLMMLRLRNDVYAKINVMGIVGIAVGAIIVAALIPTAMEQIEAVNVSNWSSSSQTLWGVIGIFIILAIAIYFINKVR